MKRTYTSYYSDEIEVYGGDGGGPGPTIVTHANGANLTSGDCFKLAWVLVRAGLANLSYYRSMGMVLKRGGMSRG